MKKKTIVYLIVDFIIAICTGIISLKMPDNLINQGLKFTSITFGSLCFVILLVNLYKKLLKKDRSKLYLIISTILYASFSILYTIIYFNSEYSNIIKSISIITFYASLIFLVFIYSTVFYLWISKRNLKNIIRALLILLLIMGLCLLFIIISKQLAVSTTLIAILNYLYISSILLLSVFIVILIFYKLVLPYNKK